MFVRILRSGTLAVFCILAMAARADEFDIDETPALSPAKRPVPMNEAGVSLGAQFGGGAAFNRFGGTPESGLSGGGWFHLQQRDTAEGGGTFYLQADGDNVDFRSSALPPDASAALRLGEQGRWDLRLHYDGIVFRQADNYHTLFNASGQLVNGLTPASINATSTNAAGVARVSQYLSAVEVGTRRDRAGGSFAYTGLDDWKFTTRLDHEHKHGAKANSVMFLSNNNFASILEPVNYDTDRFALTAAYTTRPLQAQISYIFSNFTNNVAEYVTSSPFIGTTHAGYDGTRYSLPPSNAEHRLKAQFGVNLTDTTRIATNLSYGLQLQNEAFTARHYEQAPRLGESHYDGMISTLYGNVVLTARPLQDINVRAAYTADDRDNMSASYWQKPPYRADGTAAFNGNTGIHVNPAYSFFNQKGELEAGYRLSRSTRLIADYAYRNSLRSDSVTNRNEESTMGARLQSTLAEGVSGTLGYARSIRQATVFLGNRGWNEMGRTVTAESDLRIFSYAARDRDEIKANLNTVFDNGSVVGTTARWIEDRFPDTYYGITNNHILSLGGDASFPTGPGMTAHLFYTYLENFTGMRLNASATGTNWTLRNTDGTHVLGGGVEWKINDSLKLTLDNVLTYGSTSFEEGSLWRGTGTASAANTATSLPESRSLLNSLKLAGEYQVSDGLFLGLSGLWEHYSSRDYLNTQAAASTANASTATVVVPGEGSPGYSAGMIVASARMLW
ncbi:MAG: MtrB/PioB family decaheme-associated outer membrane protein [Magnetospirillum sp.]|nr:MtrB/PioB family decaheme-associated outer membrane protein [Magnetospirillum sp.]